MERKKSRFPLIMLLIAVIMAGSYPAVQHVLGATDSEHAAAVFSGSFFETDPSFGKSAELPAEKVSGTSPDGTEPVRVADIRDTGLLALVNLDHPVRDPLCADAVVPAFRVVALATADIMMHPEALDAVKALFAAARAAGFDNLFVSSGYRDADKQKQLYDTAADRSYVQPPGHSEHQLGLAADILITGIAQDDMAAAPEGQWLIRNAWRYGFLLRYPEGKSELTGIVYEPWHFRYVGQPHAQYCHENGLCFEEYIQFLRQNRGYSLTLDKTTYSVFYETPKDGIINVPAKGDYRVSGDNTGGYIVELSVES